MHEKEPQEPPEHTSEYVKSQNFLGRAPRPPSHNPFVGPHFLYLPWAPPSSRQPWVCKRVYRVQIFVLSTLCCIHGYHTAFSKLLASKWLLRSAIDMYHGSKDGRLSDIEYYELSRVYHVSLLTSQWLYKNT